MNDSLAGADEHPEVVEPLAVVGGGVAAQLGRVGTGLAELGRHRPVGVVDVQAGLDPGLVELVQLQRPFLGPPFRAVDPADDDRALGRRGDPLQPGLGVGADVGAAGDVRAGQVGPAPVGRGVRGVEVAAEEGPVQESPPLAPDDVGLDERDLVGVAAAHREAVPERAGDRAAHHETDVAVDVHRPVTQRGPAVEHEPVPDRALHIDGVELALRGDQDQRPVEPLLHRRRGLGQRLRGQRHRVPGRDCLLRGVGQRQVPDQRLLPGRGLPAGVLTLDLQAAAVHEEQPGLVAAVALDEAPLVDPDTRVDLVLPGRDVQTATVAWDPAPEGVDGSLERLPRVVAELPPRDRRLERGLQAQTGAATPGHDPGLQLTRPGLARRQRGKPRRQTGQPFAAGVHQDDPDRFADQVRVAEPVRVRDQPADRLPRPGAPPTVDDQQVGVGVHVVGMPLDLDVALLGERVRCVVHRRGRPDHRVAAVLGHRDRRVGVGGRPARAGTEPGRSGSGQPAAGPGAVDDDGIAVLEVHRGHEGDLVVSAGPRRACALPGRGRTQARLGERQTRRTQPEPTPCPGTRRDDVDPVRRVRR